MLLRRRWLVTVAVLITGVFGGTGHALSGVQFPVAHQGWSPAYDNAGGAWSNVPPTVRITCPEPSALTTLKTLPSIRILWEGSDPDGFTGRPVKYKYILLGPSSEFPPSLAVANPDSLRRYYAGHPLGPWAGWDSTGADTTRIQFTNLITNQEYVFALIAFDETGDYSPVFSLASNMLHLAVTFEGFLGPRLTLMGPGFEYQYPSGGYCPCPSAEVPTDVAENRRVTFQWFADPDGLCQGAAIRAYRWALDIADVTDQTPRTDEQTDVRHWSSRSATATSATIGPFSSGEQHRLYVEVEDNAGLASLGIIRLTVVPESNQSPECGNAMAEPREVWPPNHEFVPVNVTGVSDPDGDPVTVTVTRVTQDEPLLGRGYRDHHHGAAIGPDTDSPGAGMQGAEEKGYWEDGRDASDGDDRKHDCADAIIDLDGRVKLRAERSGLGNGRVYTIWFSASDGHGGSCEGSVQVCVPRDRSHPRCIDDGQKFNSLGPFPCDGHGHGENELLTAVTLSPMARTGNPATVRYSLPAPARVLVAVYDVAGRRVATLENAPQGAGAHEVTWDTSSLPHGMYFCRLQAGAVTATRSLLIVR